ncbi:MAG: preprotein translocase subunit SecG [Flavobacteriaceae bacterium]|jgi:preprotein translocase subunit SecG|nr:preprotein translocase subunit SecG [Flavobacteriaceae bacterium]MCB0486180.1 preprotein translocase subunit SecG [Flavobacteriaceae bacterium]
MSYTIFLILIVVVALLLILIIMVQNPKGGGLSSSFGGQGTQNLGGVQNTTNFLDKATWTLAIALFALILLSNFSISRGIESDDSLIEETFNDRQNTNDVAPFPSEQNTAADSTSN